MGKTALITGVTGQDGQYLSEFLLDQGYRVYGLVRGQNNPKWERISRQIPGLEMIEGDLTDLSSLIAALEITKPDEIYNLGAISFVALSWTQAELTGDVTGLGVTRILEAMRRVVPSAKFYQASSSEMFGLVRETPQTELTPFHPRSPYGVAKVYGHYITVNYRESYGLFACSGILFNHESPRRGSEFVTRKITKAVARIAQGDEKPLELGRLDSKRDWGYAGDYVRAMNLMLQQDTPDDYVIASGETHTVREFVDLAFQVAGIKLEWMVEPPEGIGEYTDPALREVAVNTADRRVVVKVNKKWFRPAEVDLLMGDASKAHDKLDWRPLTHFNRLVEMMVENDLREVREKIKD